MRSFPKRFCNIVGSAILFFTLVNGPVLASNTFTVTVQSSSNYLIGGQSDPALALVRGETYIFDINASGHPFYIKNIPGTGSDNAYTNGVTGNGTTVGSLTFTDPYVRWCGSWGG